jgi:hypothetical protein
MRFDTIVARVKLACVRVLRGWLLRLDPPTTYPRELVTCAEQQVASVSNSPHTGAYKRALVFIALHRQFPQVRQRALSAVIEETVSRLP